MSIDLLTKKLIHAQKSGKLPKIVVPVHFAGQPCDMLKFMIYQNTMVLKL